MLRVCLQKNNESLPPQTIHEAAEENIMQLNFLDHDTSHLEPVNVPTASEKARQKAEILQALKWAGDDGVTTLRMREICPASLTQRISDLRKEGHNIVCRAVGNSNWYFLEVEST